VVGRRYEGLLRKEPNVTTEIVGVVGNVLKNGLDAKVQSEIYTPPQPGYEWPSEIHVVVRASGAPQPLLPVLRGLVTELEPAAALEVATLESKLAASVAQPRFAAATLLCFALVALALAATGLYGVLSYNVSQRRRELGVRAALGASRGDLVRLVLRQGLAVTAAGLLLGVAGAAALSRLLERLLFGVTPLDAVAFALAPAVLVPVALAACLLPARRAAGVEPSEALRSE
jgi:predicted lysophospholipase L1 biosynthesis ABC-type transport system permease subunit